AEQEAFYDELSTGLEQERPELTERKKQLKQLGGIGASDKATALGKEIQTLEEKIKVRTEELEVRFNTVKTLKGQIQALEKKIATDKQALQTLMNPTAPSPA
ncbi:MAG: hypothetical protein GTO41_28360, partial [Burkholderiales bacterium]|nr:hypothetical protein [Burkholderiales bacterium]